MLSGTPTTEQVTFATISATNSDGTSSFVLPFIVLRDVFYQTSFQHLTGLTTKGTELAALRGTTQTNVYLFSKLGVQNNSGTVTFSDGVSPFISRDATAVAWDGTYWALQADWSIGESGAIALWNADGTPTNAVSNTDQQAIGGRGLAFGGNKYWNVEIVGLTPTRTSVFNQFNSSTLASELAQSTIDSSINPTGIGYLNSQLYIADADGDRVWVYSSGGARGSAETYRDFTLHADNGDPTGITYLDNYWYVTETETNLVNDKIFVYPSKELYDTTVPELTKLELISRGTYKTGNAVWVRATFSGSVDISGTVTLRLNVGGVKRQAISVSSDTGTVAAPQNGVTVANFLYTIVSADTDSDGITSYVYPFSTTGVMQPAGDSLTAHSLNASTSAYRIVEPGGLNRLLASPSGKVNTFAQPDWAQTDPGNDGFIRNKPTQLIAFPNTVSLGEWTWAHDPDLGVEFDIAAVASWNQVNVTNLASLNDWTASKTLNAGQILVMRHNVTDLAKAGDIYVSGIPFQQNLAYLRSPAAGTGWNKLNGALPYQGHFYYVWQGTLTASTTVSAVERKLPYDVLTGVPSSSQYQEGTTHTDSELSYGEGSAVHITPKASLLQQARDYNIPINFSLTIRWRTKTIQGNSNLTSMRATMQSHTGATIISVTANNLPLTTWTTTKLSGVLSNSLPSYQILLSRIDNHGGAVVEIDSAFYRLSLDDELSESFDLAATAPLTVSGTDTKTIALPDGSLDAAKLNADTSTEKTAFRTAIGAGTPLTVAADAPLTVTGTSTRTLALPDASLVPDKLLSGTDTEKKAFRDKIGASASADVQLASTFTIISFAAAVQSHYEIEINIPTAMQKEAAGRPYEFVVHGWSQGRDPAQSVTVDVGVFSAANGGGSEWASTTITSANGAQQNFTLTGVLPPTQSSFIVRWNRPSGAQQYDGAGDGKITIGSRAEHVFIDTTDFDGNLSSSDDNVQDLAQKVDDLSTGAPTNLNWTPTIATGGNGSTHSLAVTRASAYQIGKLVFYGAKLTITAPSASSTGFDIYLTPPSGAASFARDQPGEVYASTTGLHLIFTDTNNRLRMYLQNLPATRARAVNIAGFYILD